MKKMRKDRSTLKPAGGGFTLIELLVVIAVLGILSAVVLVAINPAERLRSARDSGGKSDVGQIATALESYYTDNNGSYPTTLEGITILDEATEGYLKAVPAPPAGSGSDDTDYQYMSCTSGVNCTVAGSCDEFALWYDLESASSTGDWCYMSATGTASDIAAGSCTCIL